jgi:pyrimidine-nucleoside phosphorylase
MIETKRYNLRPHTEAELSWWINSYCAGSIPEYQMSAWLMAVCWRGMTLEETGILTKCMVHSGHQLQWPSSSVPRVDKHSSGGVGDKISIVLAPLVACAGIQVPMMAGRGLGHTGGTLDKLESIPGYKVQQTEENFQKIVQDIGCSIVSTTQRMVPADRKLYALRDVTGTVSSIPLQTSSILSKKIAENPDSLVLDVKYGRGSFQATVEDAHELAISLIHTAEMNNLNPTTAVLTRMDIPIGRGIGNWLEIKECLDMMKGGSSDTVSNLKQLVLCEAAQMVRQSGSQDHRPLEDIVGELYHILQTGVVLRKFRDMVEAQGGDTSVIDDPECYPSAPFQCDILAPRDGFVSDMDALVIGQASILLGAGRRVAEDDVDALAGLWLSKVVGEHVEKGDIVVTLHTSLGEDVLREVKLQVERAIKYSDEPPAIPASISHIVTSVGIMEFEMPVTLL